MTALAAGAAYAAPAGGTVSAGQATIAQSGSATTISQSSGRAVIDWSSFNIGTGESVNFIQPSSSSVALNRIHDSNPSQILGTLSANGQVWLVNPNGVFFGSTAQVNVAGLLATTADISNSNFMAGNDVFDQPGSPTASIINQGNITVQEAGLAAFVAPNLVNSGTITARLGKVQLASGDTFTLDTYGDGLISLAVSDQVTQQLVQNSGTISANGGTVQLTAAAGVTKPVRMGVSEP
jgi:filamentous hemagglutinin family protein